jgi:hypothetical protein
MLFSTFAKSPGGVVVDADRGKRARRGRPRLVVGEVGMHNTRVYKMVRLVDLAINACIVEIKYVSMAAKLTLATCHYREAIEILRKKSEFNEQELALKKKQWENAKTDEELASISCGRHHYLSSKLTSFQKHIDIWWRFHVHNYGRNICTIYGHNL